MHRWRADDCIAVAASAALASHKRCVALHSCVGPGMYISLVANIMRPAAVTVCTTALLPCNRTPVCLAIHSSFLQAMKEMRDKGKPDGEIEAFAQLFTECQKQVDSKQLRPMIRTQYMRTAFQIPFDATVRISLDTNLTMIKESVDEGDGVPLGRWCARSPCCSLACIARVSLIACAYTRDLPPLCTYVPVNGESNCNCVTQRICATWQSLLTLDHNAGVRNRAFASLTVHQLSSKFDAAAAVSQVPRPEQGADAHGHHALPARGA